MGITPTTLVDAVDDSKNIPNTSLSPIVNASNLIISIKNATTDIFGISKSTQLVS